MTIFLAPVRPSSYTAIMHSASSSIALRALPPDAPFGARGDRPIFVQLDGAQRQAVAGLPGIVFASGGIVCSFDQLAAIRIRTGIDVPEYPRGFIPPMQLPGADEFVRLGFHEALRPYQPPMAAFLATRSMALCTDAMRSGKTVTAIAAAVARGLSKVIILCPALAKLVWATEIARFVKQRALILYGRGAIRARWFCLTCSGAGALDEDRCPDCRNGSIPVKGTVDDIAEYETEVEEDAELDRARWKAQKQAVISALHEARFIICNYDLLVPQFEHDDAGKRHMREDLPGWVATLSAIPITGAIADECHLLRGRAKKDRRSLSRRDRSVMLCAGIPTVWGLTGTPFFGRTRDGWGLLDFVTNGLFGRPFFDYDRAYCDASMQEVPGGSGQKFWSNKGVSEARLPELHARLDTFVWGRPRSEIQPHMPPKTRQVVRLEVEGRAIIKGGAKGLANALRKTCSMKEDAVIEEVLAECAEGGKCLVYTYLKQNAESAGHTLGIRQDSREWRGRMEQANLRTWIVDGDLTPEARFKQAEAFRAWKGAAVWISTMDSVPGMISLKGASTVHFLDLHYDPATMLQAEERPYEQGTTGLTVRYYIAAGTVDEHVVALLLPKLAQIEAVQRDANVGSLKDTFAGPNPDDMAMAIWNRLAASLDAGAST